MSKVNREVVLKSFLDKVRNAKELKMREIKFPIREIDDLAYIICQLMTEEISKALNSLDIKEEKKTEIKPPIKRKVFGEINVIKNPFTPKVEEKINEEEIIETEPIKEDNKEIVEEPKQVIVEDTEEDEEYDDNSLYGGSW